jgi:hypothetical protein
LADPETNSQRPIKVGQYASAVLFIGSCSLRALADVVEEARLRGSIRCICMHEDCDGACEFQLMH